MLIFARVILAFMMLTAVITGILQVYMITQGFIVFSVIGLAITGLLLWLEYTNFVDASSCASKN